MKSSQKPEIHFFSQGYSFSLTNRKRLKRFLVTLSEKEKHEISSLNYIFCSDDELLEINKIYLKHDYYTDIITFGLFHKGEPISGDIYISIDRVKENARILKTTIKSELHRVIFHGLLHLCGYNDKSEADSLKMRKKEEFYLKKYGL